MIIPTLGNGMLYRVHHDKQEMLTQAEKRRALKLLCAIGICVVIAIRLWLR